MSRSNPLVLKTKEFGRNSLNLCKLEQDQAFLIKYPVTTGTHSSVGYQNTVFTTRGSFIVRRPNICSLAYHNVCFTHSIHMTHWSDLSKVPLLYVLYN